MSTTGRSLRPSYAVQKSEALSDEIFLAGLDEHCCEEECVSKLCKGKPSELRRLRLSGYKLRQTVSVICASMYQPVHCIHLIMYRSVQNTYLKNIKPVTLRIPRPVFQNLISKSAK